MSFQVRKRQTSGRLEIFRRERTCLHHYLYLIDPEFGFMHIRIQGWIPYEVQIYINGREWLARPSTRPGSATSATTTRSWRIDDLEAASRLCEHFAHRAWPRVLNAFAKMVNPLMARIRAAGYGGYYWVLDQAEIATDVMFKTRPALLRGLARPRPPRRPQLVLRRRARLSWAESSTRPWPPRWSPTPNAALRVGESATAWRGNWVKVYDKASVLRVETIINNPREFRILRVITDPRRPARAAVVSDEKGRRRPLAQLPGRHRRQPPLPRRPGSGTTQRRRRRRPGRLVPATNQSRTHLRPVQPAHPGRPGALQSRPGRASTPSTAFATRDITRRLYRRPATRPRRSPPTMRTGLSAHRQAPRPRPGRQGPALTPLPSHSARTCV